MVAIQVLVRGRPSDFLRILRHCQAELNVRQAKEQQQAALDAVVLEHQQDAANLKLIQDTYLAAQAQGDNEMAAKLKEQMTAAETKYFDSLNRMQALAQQAGQ